MAVEQQTTRTRRAILLGGLGGLAALAVDAIVPRGRTFAVDDTGSPVTVGGSFSTTLPTTVTSTSSNALVGSRGK